MRILYISGDMGVEAGGRKGAATHIRETCNALTRFGHEVLLVTPSVGDRSGMSFPVLEVTPPRSKMLGADGRYMLLDRRMARALDAAVRDFRPDAAYERYSLYQTAGQRLCARHGLPRILEVNTLLAREQRDRLRLPALAAMVERRLWRGERAIVAVSTTLKRLMTDAAGLDESRMAGFVISPVAVDPDQFHPATPPADLAAAGVNGRRKVGYTGTLTAWHGVDLFFEGARILRDGGHPVMIVAVGGETERLERLRRRAAEEGVESHLRFLGSIPHRDIPAYLAAMDVCVIPDTQDWSSPTKYFEFAAMCRPVVAARSPAVEEVFGNGEEVGLYFQRGSAASMVEQILRVLDDPALARRLGEAARRRILRNYTWRHNVAVIMELYRRMGAANAADPPGEPEA